MIGDSLNIAFAYSEIAKDDYFGFESPTHR